MSCVLDILVVKLKNIEKKNTEFSKSLKHQRTDESRRILGEF